MSDLQNEFLGLTNRFCDGVISDDEHSRLQELLRSDRELRGLFLDVVQLHGQLLWDAGAIPRGEPAEETWRNVTPAVTTGVRSGTTMAPKSDRHRWSAAAILAVTTMTAVVVVALAFRSDTVTVVPSAVSNVTDSRESPQVLADALNDNSGELQPLALPNVVSKKPETRVETIEGSEEVVTAGIPEKSLDDSEIVAGIDKLLEASWQENQIRPAPDAEDYEWLRRTYITLTGRIPSVSEVQDFERQPDGRRRETLTQSLLDDQRTSENLAVTWTNLLIGRTNARGVDEDALFEFLKSQFQSNQPWMNTVGELIAAEGRSDENGATNFLLAHLNDQATPATAVTARLFLGRQVHCTQCHDHPFAKDRTQEEFWSLNAFFKSTVRSVAPESESSHGNRVWMLADTGSGGMTFYDTLRGQKKAVPPQFAGKALPADGKVARRVELARLLNEDSDRQVARAMVNRMWAHFFGYGFTNPVDDLGPHNPASHPELLEYLTDAFVNSRYDLRRLMRWMVSNRAFQLSSSVDPQLLSADDPEEGGVPLFSRAYARPMGPEQVYDSIRIAIRSAAGQPIDSSVGTDHRRQWIDQFVRSYGTDENDEQLAFEGNISQALLMMNGEDVQQAIPLAAAEIARSVQHGTGALSELLNQLALATMNREPTVSEDRVFRSRFRALSRSLPQDEAMRTVTEDMLWAYLNSSEFTSVH